MPSLAESWRYRSIRVMRITSLVRVMLGLVGACIHAETRVLSEAHSFCRAERDLWTPKRSYPRWVTMDPGEQEDMAVLIHVTNPWTCLETALERVCHNKYWATFCLLLVPVSREPTETPGTFKCFFFFQLVNNSTNCTMKNFCEPGTQIWNSQWLLLPKVNPMCLLLT